MARLRLAATVPAPREAVYRHITAFGPGGPETEDAFREKYGEVLERQGSSFLTRDVQGEQTLHWRWSFHYPERRDMMAVDSSWSDRSDSFQPAARGTRWVVTFTTKRTGPIGAVQWFFFQLFGRRTAHRGIVRPVLEHFQPTAPREV